MKISRRPVFLSDVEDCADYLVSEASEEIARKWKKALTRTIALMSKSPEIGRIRRDLPFPGIRSFFVTGYPRYLVFYRISGDTLELLRVRHGMMHLPGLFEAAAEPRSEK